MPIKPGPYTPPPGAPGAGHTYRSHYAYRTQVLAVHQGYRDYQDQQKTRRELRAAGVPVSDIVAALRRDGSSHVEARVMTARDLILRGDNKGADAVIAEIWVAAPKLQVAVNKPGSPHRSALQRDIFPDSP